MDKRECLRELMNLYDHIDCALEEIEEEIDKQRKTILQALDFIQTNIDKLKD